MSQRATVRRLTSDRHGNPRWEATVKGQDHEVVWREYEGLWCVTCNRGDCAGVTATAPHTEAGE